MEMAVRPPQGQLKNVMKLSNGSLGLDEETTPNEGVVNLLLLSHRLSSKVARKSAPRWISYQKWESKPLIRRTASVEWELLPCLFVKLTTPAEASNGIVLGVEDTWSATLQRGDLL